VGREEKKRKDRERKRKREQEKDTRYIEKKKEGAMTATCSQGKFLEAVKKFHCCPFSRVVFMSQFAFFILLFLFLFLFLFG